MYKNMKIEINEEQPLDEVVKELERLGYKKWAWFGDTTSHNAVYTWEDGDFSSIDDEGEIDECFIYGVTTLAELKEM